VRDTITKKVGERGRAEGSVDKAHEREKDEALWKEMKRRGGGDEEDEEGVELGRLRTRMKIHTLKLCRWMKWVQSEENDEDADVEEDEGRRRGRERRRRRMEEAGFFLFQERGGGVSKGVHTPSRRKKGGKESATCKK
jgi:hypothetical protein